MDEIEITPEDRAKYPCHTDGAILGIKRVALVHDDDLKSLLDDKSSFEELRQEIGGDTNPSWLRAQIAEALYDRDLIDEVEFDYLSR